VAAVAAAISALEDSPLFNAGRGGIPNRAGFVELDASIMEGRHLNAGAVAAVRVIKNPIAAARAAMEHSPHLMFVDRGAVAFARQQKLDIVDPGYFLVPTKKTSKGKSGTVGAVALDRCGDLAAGTSTGGYNTKIPGRVGDSPIIGAGTYADNKTCAVSATGHGEYFIRFAAAHDVSALVAYRGWTIKKAAAHVIHNKLKPAGGLGGFIVIDRKGNMAWPYSSKGMIRGYIKQSGVMKLGVFEKME
jgi:beta-aspartyl-peptidase (threonine type)